MFHEVAIVVEAHNPAHETNQLIPVYHRVLEPDSPQQAAEESLEVTNQEMQVAGWVEVNDKGAYGIYAPDKTPLKSRVYTRDGIDWYCNVLQPIWFESLEEAVQSALAIHGYAPPAGNVAVRIIECARKLVGMAKGGNTSAVIDLCEEMSIACDELFRNTGERWGDKAGDEFWNAKINIEQAVDRFAKEAK